MLIVAVLLCFVCVQCTDQFTDYHGYPSYVPKMQIRKDFYTGKQVSSGKAHLLKNKVPLAEFKKHMQCLKDDPNFNYNGGSVDLMRMIPSTREIAQLAAAYAESHCGTWLHCQSIVRENNAKNESTKRIGGFHEVFMIRIYKNKVYWDWPWKPAPGAKDYESKNNEIMKLIRVVISAISDMRDCVFMAGGEQCHTEYSYPFPTFSSAPMLGHADMPWPWLEAWRSAQHHYFHLLNNRLDINNETHNHNVHKFRPWKERVNKAALFGSTDSVRMVMFDVGRKNPDLIDSAALYANVCVRPYHPQSPEDCVDREVARNISKGNHTHLPPGYITPYLNDQHTSYTAGAYKYVVVPLGLDGKSTSGRLPILLANSGAVILMPHMPLVYHFSAQLKPWVHFVPLSYSGADLASKVRWLRDHDDLARQIAENGRTFARSYLRLEDYYCYAANALDMVAELQAGSNVTEPFNLKNVSFPLERVRMIVSDGSEQL